MRTEKRTDGNALLLGLPSAFALKINLSPLPLFLLPAIALFIIPVGQAVRDCSEKLTELDLDRRLCPYGMG